MTAENSNASAPSNARGRPFQKGETGNPGGRPKTSKEFRLKCREVTSEVIEFWLTTMRNTRAKTIDRLRASECLMAYGWGKPTQKVEIEDDRPNLTVNIRELLAAKLNALANAPAPAERVEQSATTVPQ